MRQLDTLTEFRYDPRANRYRVRSGAGVGRFISKDAFLAATERHLQSKKAELIALSDDAAKDIRAFQTDAATILREIHASQAILGHGGVETMSAKDWGRVGNELIRQYRAGVDEVTGRRYGLKHLAQEILSGELTTGQIRQRLTLYAESGKRSYWAAIAARNATKPFAKRQLGVAEHCPDCLGYAARGVVARESLPLPTVACECRVNCRCSIAFYTLEEAIGMGAKL